MRKRTNVYLDDETKEHAEIVRRSIGERSMSSTIRKLIEIEYNRVTKTTKPAERKSKDC